MNIQCIVRINLIGTSFHNVIVNNSVGLFYLEIQIVPTVDIRHGDGIMVSFPYIYIIIPLLFWRVLWLKRKDVWLSKGRHGG